MNIVYWEITGEMWNQGRSKSHEKKGAWITTKTDIAYFPESGGKVKHLDPFWST